MSQGRPERPVSQLHLWEIRSIRDVLAVVIVAGLFWLGYAMRDVTVPLLVALLLAYLFEPLVAWMAHTRWIPLGRVGAVSVLLSVAVLVVLAALALLVPRVVNQAVSLVDEVENGNARQRVTKLVEEYVPTEYLPDAMRVVDHLPDGSGKAASADIAESSASQSERVVEQGAKVAGAVKKANEQVDLVGLASKTGRVAWMVVGQITAIGMLLFLIPFYFFFFSLWFPHVEAFGVSLVPVHLKDTVLPLLRRMDAAVAGFVRGRIVISAIMAALLCIGWEIVGVPYAILLGIVIGAFCLVPFLGLVGVPAAVVLLAVAQLDLPDAQRMAWWGILLWPTLVFSIVQALDGWVLTPMIAGKATNLDPVTIFVAVLAGGSVLGAYGMLIAIPVAACVKILLSDLVIPKLRAMAHNAPSGGPPA